MADKDDLFQEEDGTKPQDQDRDEPSSDEDDDIIDLLDTVEIPAEDTEEDIIELEDMIETPDDEILELTEEIQESVADDDDVLDLTEVVTDEDEPQDDILELTDIADAGDAQDDWALDLTQKTEAPDVDDDIIDLTEPVTEDEAMDFLDTVEIPAQDMEQDSLEPADTAQEARLDTGDDIIDLTEPVAEDEAMDFLDTVEIPAQDMTQDSLEPADTAQEAGLDTGDDLFDPAEAVADIDIDKAAMEPVESDEPMEPEQEERFEETIALPSTGYEEDKELLELIDDIQATLNDEPLSARARDQEDTPQGDESIDTDTLEEDADDEYTFLDDDDLIKDGDITESETEFVDHLGIDLTSEIERKALEESQEAVMEDVKPTENMDAGIAPGALETAVKQALSEMLADENNPLAKAIENAVRKALGHGENT